MKISKLFHWLYGVVMLLPIFAIGVTCVTTFWNETIEMPSTEVIETPSYSTNDVSSVDDLVQGNIYDFTISINYNGAITYFRASEVYNVPSLNYDLEFDTLSYTDGYVLFKEASSNFRISSSNNPTTEINLNYNSSTKPNMVGLKFQFVYYDSFNAEYISCVSRASWLPPATYEVIEHTSDDLNVFYYAVDKVCSSSLFGWAANSFLSAPFVYIVSLFSMPFDSPVVIFLSYWLSISIIWLVFDLVMYIPLLVHRWLDKGIIE